MVLEHLMQTILERHTFYKEKTLSMSPLQWSNIRANHKCLQFTSHDKNSENYSTALSLITMNSRNVK